MPYCGNCGNQLSDLAVACPKCGSPTARGLAQPAAPVLSREYRSAPALRPLGVGEIIDAAIKIYRANAATLLTLSAIVIVPVQVISGLILASAPTSLVTRVGTSAPLQQTPSIDTSRIWTFVAATLLVVALGLVASQLATAASLRTVIEAYLGETPDWRESLTFAFKRIGPLVRLALLTGLLSGFAALACLVPGLYLYVAWSVSVPVMLSEEAGVLRSMSRSRELVRGRWWYVAGVLALSQLVAFGLRLILGLGFSLLLLGSHSAITTFIRSAVVGSISGVLITPFLAAAIAVMYIDLRVRKEGFDLELLVQRVGRPDLVPPQAPTATFQAPPRRAAPRRPGFVADDDAPQDDAPHDDAPHDSPPPPRKRPAPRKPVVRKPAPDPVEPEEPDETPPPAPPKRPAPRKPSAPRRPPPPPDDFPDDPEFGHS